MIHPDEPDADFKMMSDPDEWFYTNSRLPLKRTIKDQPYKGQEYATLVLTLEGVKFVRAYLVIQRIPDEVLATAPIAKPRELVDAGWLVD